MAKPNPRENGRRLDRFLEANGISRRKAAEVFGVTHPAIVGWVAGVRPKGDTLRQAIERWTNGAVPADGWEDAEQRQFRTELADVAPFKPSTGTGG